MLDLSVKDLADAVDMSAAGITKIEKGLTKPYASTIQKIQEYLESRDLEFIEDDGVKFQRKIYRTLCGQDNYINLIDDIYYTLRGIKGECLFLFADDRLSSEVAIEAEKRLRFAGIRMRNIINENNDFLRYPLKEYKAIPSLYFRQSLIVIYGRKVAVTMRDESDVIILSDNNLAEAMRSVFEFFWAHGTDAKSPSQLETR